MWFMGYGYDSNISNYISDFLFYPSDSDGEKVIEFDILSSGVRSHSMDGAGFLINAGLDTENVTADSIISGYILYIQFTPTGSNSPPTGAQMKLLKIKDNVKASDFHRRSSPSLINSSLVQVVATADNNADFFFESGSFKNEMSLNVTFDDTKISVTTGADDEKVAIEWAAVAASGFSITKDGEADLDTGHHGFGPLVDYTGLNHSCETTSAYKFSNLKMQFQLGLLDTLLEQQFYSEQNVDRYFVNLVGSAVGKDTPAFWDGMARLRTDKIFYVTNDAESDILGAEGASGNNGTVLENIDGEATYASIISELGDYILSTTSADWDDDLPTLEIETPVAAFDLVGIDENFPDGTEIVMVERQMLPENPVAVFANNKSTINDGEIDKLVFTVKYPDDTDDKVVTFTSLEDIDLFALIALEEDDDDNLPPVGVYSVSLVAYDGDVASTNRAVKSFKIIEDMLPPVTAVNTKASTGSYTEYESGNVDGLFAGTSVVLTISDDKDGWGVKAYRIDLLDAAGKVVSSSYTSLDALKSVHSVTLGGLDKLSSRVTQLRVTAWDWTANELETKGEYAAESAGGDGTGRRFVIDLAFSTVKFADSAVYGRISDLDMPVDHDGEFYINGSKPGILVDNTDGTEIGALVGGGMYKLLGYSTSPYAFEPMEEDDFVVLGNMTLYPVLEYVGKAAALDLSYDTAPEAGDFWAEISAGGKSAIYYSVIPFDLFNMSANPADYSGLEIEWLAGGNDGWTSLGLGEGRINGPLSDMTEGHYLVLAKAVDADGSIGYKVSEPIYYSGTPDPVFPGFDGVTVNDVDEIEEYIDKLTDQLEGVRGITAAAVRDQIKLLEDLIAKVTADEAAKTVVGRTNPSKKSDVKDLIEVYDKLLKRTDLSDDELADIERRRDELAETLVVLEGLSTSGGSGDGNVRVGAELPDSIFENRNIITADDIAAIKAGGSVNLEIVASRRGDNAVDGDIKALIDDLVKNNKNLGFGGIIDLGLLKTVLSAGGAVDSTDSYTQLSAPLRVSLTLEDGAGGLPRLYQMVGGQLVEIVNLSEVPLSFLFDTALLGQLFVFYEGGSPVPPDMGADGAGMLWLAAAFVSVCGMAVVMPRRKVSE